MLEFLKSNEKGKAPLLLLLILGAAVGVFLLLWGGNVDDAGTKAEGTASENDEWMRYKAELEAEIKRLCEAVDGVGKVTVSVTLSGTFEEIYATEYSEKGEEYVIVGSGASASPIKLTRITPTVTGVGIVCAGGSSDRVKNALIPLLSTALSISSNRIYIADGG